jgi:Rieske Fe-S protein
MKTWDDERPRENPGGPEAPSRAALEFPGRRSFIVVLLAAGGAVVGALLAVPLAVFTADPLFRKTGGTQWSDAGPVSQFAGITQPAEPVLKVEKQDGWRLLTTDKPVFVIPPGAGPHRVLSPVCPHLGCQVEWVDGRKQFYCPCHGSEFAPDGSLTKGPAPRGLDYLDSKVEQGRLLVKYQYFRLLVAEREVIG